MTYMQEARCPIMAQSLRNTIVTHVMYTTLYAIVIRAHIMEEFMPSDTLPGPTPATIHKDAHDRLPPGVTPAQYLEVRQHVLPDFDTIVEASRSAMRIDLGLDQSSTDSQEIMDELRKRPRDANDNIRNTLSPDSESGKALMKATGLSAEQLTTVAGLIAADAKASGEDAGFRFPRNNQVEVPAPNPTPQAQAAAPATEQQKVAAFLAMSPEERTAALAQMSQHQAGPNGVVPEGRQMGGIQAPQPSQGVGR
jgi:hypothetical protein